MSNKERLLKKIEDEFTHVDLSFIASVEYYSAWTSWEEYGSLVIFKDEIGGYWYEEGASMVMAEDNTNYWNPTDITEEQALQMMKDFDARIEENNQDMESM